MSRVAFDQLIGLALVKVAGSQTPLKCDKLVDAIKCAMCPAECKTACKTCPIKLCGSCFALPTHACNTVKMADRLVISEIEAIKCQLCPTEYVTECYSCGDKFCTPCYSLFSMHACNKCTRCNEEFKATCGHCGLKLCASCFENSSHNCNNMCSSCYEKCQTLCEKCKFNSCGACFPMHVCKSVSAAEGLNEITSSPVDDLNEISSSSDGNLIDLTAAADKCANCTEKCQTVCEKCKVNWCDACFPMHACKSVSTGGLDTKMQLSVQFTNVLASEAATIEVLKDAYKKAPFFVTISVGGLEIEHHAGNFSEALINQPKQMHFPGKALALFPTPLNKYIELSAATMTCSYYGVKYPRVYFPGKSRLYCTIYTYMQFTFCYF